MDIGHQKYYQKTIKQFFSNEEVKELHDYSDWKGLWEVMYNWLWIVGAFALIYFLPNVLTVVLAMLVIGGRQLGCAMIMHDTGHNSLFKSKKLNLIFGNWLGAFPIFMNMPKYGKYHLEHHLHTGLEDDPDTGLTKGYPAKKWSMFRKILRDFVGLTGAKGFFGILTMHAEYIHFELGGRVIKNKEKYSAVKRLFVFARNFAGPFVANSIIFLLCLLVGKPLLYLLWIGSFLTTFYFCIRIRSLAEHSVVPDAKNPLLNTRTTKANFIAKMLFAPLHVNFHAEHHLMMSVPCYHLPKMNKMLRERGFYEKAVSADNYWTVFKLAIRQ